MNAMSKKQPANKDDQNLEVFDIIWERIQTEGSSITEQEPLLKDFVSRNILLATSFADILARRFACSLNSHAIDTQALYNLASDIYQGCNTIEDAARADLIAYLQRDPACHRLLQPILYFKGFLALQAHRIAHELWKLKRHNIAYFIQMRCSELFSIDIHPGARIGKGIMIDHAHSIVVGETAVIGDNVSILHSVTLGGTGKNEADRHPKIGDGVLIGAGAKILGNITIGNCSKIAAGSLVLKDVPMRKTVAGVPAHIVGDTKCAEQPAANMDQLLSKY